ncbi:DUF2585 domain-containing protein [Nitratireductor sp. ZSWI3]|uniref:DUF2585 domain-containing protein n=1 Tax=Nitratireductor sp. ZSWI3 TaxID=2966359 RepID=UPI00214F8910|nr:DUF2585 domain-containing protein [Nitratireductor sp. ZSWI3]MCR4267458.1 DUF2585 domain-containing protein [Nitratireductor sp. ZSWI3]
MAIQDTWITRTYRYHPVLLTLSIIAAILAAQALFLAAMGHPAICDCGTVKLLYPDPSGPETSQHLTDWYTYSHILHGLIFYMLLWIIAPRMPVGLRLALAVGIEAAWEMAENTPMVINRYRQSALAEGYYGDSIVNSISDTFAAIFGFLVARLSPVWLSLALLVATEAIMAYMIRDNLTLNILQLLYPSEAVSNWQRGG